MYILTHKGMIENKLLTYRLLKYGCHPCEITHGLWKHDTIPVTALLTVDDFGVKYVGKGHVTRLVDAY